MVIDFDNERCGWDGLVRVDVVFLCQWRWSVYMRSLESGCLGRGPLKFDLDVMWPGRTGLWMRVCCC